MLVVSNKPFNQAMPILTILPLTSTQRRSYPAEVPLPENVAGQPQDSIVMPHQIRTISKQRIASLVGDLTDPSLRQQVQLALRDHLDLT